jgi:hypothetical protein
VIAVKSLETNQGLANWDAEFEAAADTAMSPSCKRALLGVKLASIWVAQMEHAREGLRSVRLNATYMKPGLRGRYCVQCP